VKRCGQTSELMSGWRPSFHRMRFVRSGGVEMLLSLLGSVITAIAARRGAEPGSRGQERHVELRRIISNKLLRRSKMALLLSEAEKKELVLEQTVIRKTLQALLNLSTATSLQVDVVGESRGRKGRMCTHSHLFTGSDMQRRCRTALLHHAEQYLAGHDRIGTACGGKLGNQPDEHNCVRLPHKLWERMCSNTPHLVVVWFCRASIYKIELAMHAPVRDSDESSRRAHSGSRRPPEDEQGQPNDARAQFLQWFDGMRHQGEVLRSLGTARYVGRACACAVWCVLCVQALVFGIHTQRYDTAS